MSVHYLYRLYDPKTGALLHEGTPTELVAAGLFPDQSGSYWRADPTTTSTNG